MRWLLLSILILQVATCGQKGPLTLPSSADPRLAASVVAD